MGKILIMKTEKQITGSAAILLEIKKQLGWRNEKLCVLLDKGIASIYRYLNGEAPLSFDDLDKIQQLINDEKLDMNISNFINYSSKKQNG